MASTAASTKSVDESLWWDPFSILLNDLENAPLSPSSELPSSLANKLKRHHAWLLDSIALFKPPNQTSKSALDSSEIAIGSHRLVVKSKLKAVALEVSSCACLDEVQSYILVTRSIDCNHLDSDYKVKEFLHLILLQYYLERQCLLKCVRQILLHALYIGNESLEGNSTEEEVLQLVNDGLERNLLSVLQDLLSSKHPEHMEVDLAILWAEEILIEVNLLLDILFLVYYETFCTCKGEQWKRLCSLFKGMLSNSLSIERLAISIEATSSLYYAKVQLLLILIETLDLDNLLRMVHDEVPFRQGHSTFSLADFQEMDAIVSSFNALETAEAGPLILAWAVFLCLISSLPEKQDCSTLVEIDHIAYVRQAFEATPLSYFLEILYNDVLRDSDSHIAGYRSVLRTFISAFIASYEITHQLEGNTFEQILDILCMIYRGEESLCMQFWDKNSFVDGPIRCLLCSLESEFPFRTVELVRLLSALCEGTWPAECVYNFLDKMVGMTSLFEIPGDSCANISQIVVTPNPMHVPGVEGLLIPRGTCGHVLRVLDGKNALIRWEYMQSGIFLLLLRLVQEYNLNSYEDVFVTVDLLCRMVLFNKALCFALMDIDNSLSVKAARMDGNMETNICVDVVKIICSLVSNLEPNVSNAGVMSTCISILTNFLNCSTWLLSGGLARMLLYDCEQNGECCSLTISVLDFTMQLVETGVEDDMVSALVVFSLQYVFVNHEHWKYKLKHVRWKVTLKVLEVMKKCIKSVQNSQKLGCLIWDILLGDSSIHSALCRIMCIRTETLERIYISRLYDLKEIEGLQLAVCSVLDIVSSVLADLSKDFVSGLPAFHQAMLSSTTKPVPVVTAMISLISLFRNPEIQVAAARVLSMLCIIAEKAQSYSYGDVCLVSDDSQIRDLTTSISQILSEETIRKNDLLVAVLALLTSAAHYQPAFLISIMSTKENVEVSTRKDNLEASFGSSRLKKTSLIQSLLQYVERSEDLIASHPRLLLNVLNFLKALWQGAAQYMQILDRLKNSEKFWKHLLSSILTFSVNEASSLENMKGDETLQVAYRYQCQSAVLEIVAHEMFLQKKLLHGKKPEKKSSKSSEGRIENTVNIEKEKFDSLHDLMAMLSNWCEHSVMENLVRLYASGGYDRETVGHAKMAASLCIVHAMERISIGDDGSLSLSLVEKINKIFKKLTEQPAFSELKAQYSSRGYSEGKELSSLILSDLYYHLQGELEGREIAPGPFKELSLHLLQSEILQTNKKKINMEFCLSENNIHLFNPVQLRADLGLNFWDHSDWKAFKPVAERMLVYMHDANSLAFLMDSKHSSLKALAATLSLYEGNLTETETGSLGGGISEPLMESCISYLCKCLQSTAESLVSAPDASEDILNYLTTQGELLLNLLRFLYRRVSVRNNKQQCLPLCTLVMRTSGPGLRVLSDIRPSTPQLKKTVKLFLTLLLTAIEFSYPKSHVEEKSHSDAVDAFAEVSLVSLAVLPVLCNFIEISEYCNLSAAAIDMLLKGFSTYNTWLPILQKHLQLHNVLSKLLQKDSLVSIPIILRFLLTLARIRGGAEMLQTINLFSSLKVLFALLLDDKPFPNGQEESDKEENPHNIWGLGLAIVSAMICSLGDDPSCIDIVESVIPYFSEKSYLIFFYLSAPDVPTDDHSKKRARTQRVLTSLTALRETEHTLMLICMLVKHQHSWSKAMKEMDSQLRERSIHLLAFISKGPHRIGESPRRTAPLLCPPILKEEVESNGRPPSIDSKHGWFILSALGCGSEPPISSVSSTALSLPIKDRASGRADSIHRTYFTDSVAIQTYRIAFLILKFLCLQAKAAAKRAEEVGFIDLAHFPELPMPEILHGLQDQAIAIITELCEANKSKAIQPNIQDLCLMLLQALEMALYLETCVSQTCGIRPVLGRIEDFSKEIKALIQVAEKHAYLKATLKSLKQIIALLYPGLLQTEGIM
ncbi:uncharacterized protein LOC131243494 isoform X2 [Magnolia sinica]|uniref:uncharacterized protein LOC131243494 isoform X2 n=1 Tax=Magnolia sinica TaxID=86752 RepID=UPI002658A667|nr:uncharacterized protein LOC131243494 isoform X2 [Magnolia sinica]